jgi:SAM-dependent methyltransferase
VDGKRLTILEVGCGVGNFMFPLLNETKDLYFYACDFSPRAIQFINVSHFQFSIFIIIFTQIYSFMNEWICVLLRPALSVSLCYIRASRSEFWTEDILVWCIICSIHLVIRHTKPDKKNFTTISISGSECQGGMENPENVVFSDLTQLFEKLEYSGFRC